DIEADVAKGVCGHAPQQGVVVDDEQARCAWGGFRHGCTTLSGMAPWALSSTRVSCAKARSRRWARLAAKGRPSRSTASASAAQADRARAPTAALDDFRVWAACWAFFASPVAAAWRT